MVIYERHFSRFILINVFSMNRLRGKEVTPCFANAAGATSQIAPSSVHPVEQTLHVHRCRPQQAMATIAGGTRHHNPGQERAITRDRDTSKGMAVLAIICRPGKQPLSPSRSIMAMPTRL